MSLGRHRRLENGVTTTTYQFKDLCLGYSPLARWTVPDGMVSGSTFPTWSSDTGMMFSQSISTLSPLYDGQVKAVYFTSPASSLKHWNILHPVMADAVAPCNWAIWMSFATHTAHADYGAMFTNGTSQGLWMQSSNRLIWYSGGADQVVATLTNKQTYDILFVKNGATTKGNFYVDGVPTGPLITVSNINYSYMGAGSAASYPFKAYVMEVALWAAMPSSSFWTDAQTIAQNLHRYRLDVYPSIVP